MLVERLHSSPELAAQVHDSLLEAICAGRLAPGERITQEGLAETFGVSRQPVLQALMLLRRAGFIVDAGRKGIRVAPLDPHQTRDLYEVRAALDGAACRAAARRMDAALAARGRAVLADAAAARASGDAAALIAVDVAFHRFIYEASGNALFAATAAPHWSHLRRVMGAVLRGPDGHERVWREHAAILEAMVAGDGGRAEALARAHAEGAAARLLDGLPRAAVAAPDDERQAGDVR
ncbi:MAG: GntR family transcriptional regulator [Rhodospirillales bacterium]|nr:MAG: GntR family transcriptional regulator [Rhodospirillales bacterium]